MSAHHCTFCGKGDDDVACLVAGPKVMICDECVDLCVDIVAENRLKRLVVTAVVAALADHEPAKPVTFWARMFPSRARETGSAGV